MQLQLLIVAYVAPLLLIWLAYTGWQMRKNRVALAVREEAFNAGLSEPASLHPLINPEHCIGCGACVNACPEGKILGLINGKAELVEPTRCIGHGACAAACPMGAIELVFGTQKRGIDIPHVGPDFQTNVPGIYIAGELGGMGLIRNAIEQGRQAMDEIAKQGRQSAPDIFDVIIIGAGPAGFSATLAAKQHGLHWITLEQDSFGGTVSHYPRGKLVMTQPTVLPIHGAVKLRATTKEELLDLWLKIANDNDINICFGERVESIDPTQQGFSVSTTKGSHVGKSILLTIGRRGTPRKLGVPGENQSKVVYQLIDPQQYRGQKVTVVGGGDSALEAATAIAEEPDTYVTLSYRGDAFSRAKTKNRERLGKSTQCGRLNIMLNSNVHMIGEHHIEIEQQGTIHKLENERAIICLGGTPPTDFLKSIGITIETKHGTV